MPPKTFQQYFSESANPIDKEEFECGVRTIQAAVDILIDNGMSRDFVKQIRNFSDLWYHFNRMALQMTNPEGDESLDRPREARIWTLGQLRTYFRVNPLLCFTHEQDKSIEYFVYRYYGHNYTDIFYQWKHLSAAIDQANKDTGINTDF